MPASLGTVVVAGSVHIDLIASASRMPGPGDSVSGTSFVTAPGGKAANQACQIARCGLDVALIGKIGNDQHGAFLRSRLEEAGIGTRFLTTDPVHPTGTSTVLAASGEYVSIIVPGAAAQLTIAEIDTVCASLDNPLALVVQLELPISTVSDAARSAATRGMLVVLNASPVPDNPETIPAALWDSTDLLIANHAEAKRLLGVRHGKRRPAEIARDLATASGVGIVVMTLGAEGAVAVDNGSIIEQAAFSASVVDSIGAGDAFLGTLVAGIIEGQTIAEAMRRAAAAGAIAVQGRGALDSIPAASQIDAFLERHSGH
jgi:ribokinase